MPKKTLVVTRRLPPEVESRIIRDYTARLNSEDRLYSSDELIDISAGADALLITQQDVMDAKCARPSTEFGARDRDSLRGIRSY